MFYNLRIDEPLSKYHDTPEWDNSRIGQLNNYTNGQVYIREIPFASRSKPFGWRVVDAYFSQEDSTITYFRAFDMDGWMLPEATFGVHWSSVPDRIGGGFKHQLEFGRRYYIPVENKFPTVESGGYTVQVLDTEYPSEGLAFGLAKSKYKHEALVVTFRLLPLDESYPAYEISALESR